MYRVSVEFESGIYKNYHDVINVGWMRSDVGAGKNVLVLFYSDTFSEYINLDKVIAYTIKEMENE